MKVWTLFLAALLAAAVEQGMNPDTTYYSSKSPIIIPMGLFAEPWVDRRGRAFVHDGHDYYSHHRRLDVTGGMTTAIGVKTNMTRYAYDFVIVDEAAAKKLARREYYDAVERSHAMLESGRPRPVFGMNRGTVGFLMNEWRLDRLAERIAGAKAIRVAPRKNSCCGRILQCRRKAGHRGASGARCPLGSAQQVRRPGSAHREGNRNGIPVCGSGRNRQTGHH